ncbi:MAG TPA: hypothetical protein VE953_28475 [Terriglobales bacterium]|nr:hypothetical protein [Terriglobales bacterium]
MTRLVRALVALAGTVLVTLALAPLTSASATDGMFARDVLQFDTAFANVSPFIGANGAIRGVTAAPFPWAIRSIHGDLDANGQLTVDVDHLVLANDPAVPANLRGTNPVPFFAAIVSCETSVNGTVAVSNVTSANFRATMPGGNAFIHQRLSLPHPCAAPDVFITSPNGGVWFAATGTAGSSERDVLQFDTMFANVSPFIGAAGTITGVTAAPLPWQINREIRGDLDADGHLSIDVDGLVLANDPAVPANLRGTNPVPFFAGVVTCRTNVNGKVAAVRSTTANFPASAQGNARIRATLSLPSPCATPYVFVTSPNGGVWFAVTGNK